MVVAEEGHTKVMSRRVSSAIMRHPAGDGEGKKIFSVYDIIREAYSPLPSPLWRQVSTQMAPPCVPPRPALFVSSEGKQGGRGGYLSEFSRQRMTLPVC